jgi:HSP20 family protein
MSFADLQSSINNLFGDFMGGSQGRRRGGRGRRGGLLDPFGLDSMDPFGGWDDFGMWDTTPMLLAPTAGTTGGIGQQGGVGKGLEESKMEDAGGQGTAVQTQQGGQLSQQGGLQLPVLRCRVNVEDAENQFKVTAEVPGFDKENLKVNISDDNVLTITGEQRKEHIDESKDKRYLRSERVFGRVMRSLRLPKNIDKGKVNASYLNGILHIDVPKSEVKEGQAINIA